MRNKLFLAVLAILADVGLIACSGANVAGPSNVPTVQAPPAQTTTTPPATVPGPVEESYCKSRYTAEPVNFSAGDSESGTFPEGKAKIKYTRKNAENGEEFHLASYDGIGPGHNLVDVQYGSFAPGANVIFLEVNTLCEVETQLDAGCKTAPNDARYSPGYFNKHWNRKGAPCKRTPPPPNPTCADITKNLTLNGQDGSTVSVNVSFSAGTAVITWGDSSSQPVSNGNYSHAFAQSDTEKSYTISLIVTYNGTTCDPTVKVVIVPAKPKTCYTPPSITLGSPNVTTTATQVTVNGITASPAGGTFAPTLPQTYSRPADGQPSQIKTFTYTVYYDPENLACTASKSTDVVVPPQEPPPPPDVCFCHVTSANQGGGGVNEVNLCLPPSGFTNGHGGLMTPAPHFPVPNGHQGGTHSLDYMGQCDGHTIPTCEELNPPSATFDGFDDKKTGNDWRLSGTVTVHNAGNWEARLYAASSMAEYNSNSPDYTKDTASANKKCEQSATLEVSYKWDNHPSEYWWVAWYRNGNFVAKSPVIQNTHN